MTAQSAIYLSILRLKSPIACIIICVLHVPNCTEAQTLQAFLNPGFNFSGTGDVFGSELNVGIGANINKIHFGITHGILTSASSGLLSQDDFLSERNLLIAHSSNDNYPGPIFREQFDGGFLVRDPKSDIVREQHYGIYSWYELPVKGFRLMPKVAAAIVRRQSTNVFTVSSSTTLDGPIGNFSATVPVSILQNYAYFALDLGLAVHFDLLSTFRVGPTLNYLIGEDVNASLGLDLVFLMPKRQE